MKRRWKILLTVFVLAVIGFFLLLPSGSHRRNLEAYKRELLARGEKLTIVELAPPRPTNISAAAKLFSSGTNLGWSDLPTRMRMVAPGRAQVTFTNITPTLMLDYQQNTNTAATVRKVLVVPQLEFDLDYSQGFELRVPHEAVLKQAELIAANTAMQALYQKDYDEAWANILAAADIVRLFKNDYMMISDLVRIADAAIAYTANWEALEGAHWTDAQLAQLQAKWEEMDLFQNAVKDIDMDRAINSQTFAVARGAEPGGQIFVDLASSTPVPAPAPRGPMGRIAAAITSFYDRGPRIWIWKSSWSYDEELFELQSVSAAKESALRIIATSAAAPALAELRLKQANINHLHKGTQSHFMIAPTADTHINYLSKLAEVETARRIHVTAIALKRYQLRHGSNPAALGELVPEFLAKVPIDFMDGKPLRYRRLPDGDFLLYSVGQDGEDNGGDGSFSTPSYYWIRARDIVWPRPATAQEISAYEKAHPAPPGAPAK